jgi:two-component system CheB/CheR fusion protein
MRRSSTQAASPGSGDASFSDTVLDALPSGVLVVDAELLVLRANARYCELAGTVVEETVGVPLFELSDGAWKSPVVRGLVDDARAGRAGRAEVEFDPATGHRRVVRVDARPLPGAGRRVLLVVDGEAGAGPGARKARPDEDGSRDEIVARAAHELRGPLGSISNWVHLLSQGPRDDALQKQGLAAIQRALNVATRLIESLNDVSLLRAGRVTLRAGLVDLASVVDMALDRPKAAAHDKGVSLEVVREVPSVPVMGDPDRLQQIVLHLLANAVECTPAGGRVEVSVGREAASWRLAVSDTGRGIAPDVLPRVFGGLRAADFAGPRPPGTLGAGLTIVRHLAELHGGSVEASSAGPGLGARFVVRLPVPALAPSSHAPSGALASTGKTASA